MRACVRLVEFPPKTMMDTTTGPWSALNKCCCYQQTGGGEKVFQQLDQSDKADEWKWSRGGGACNPRLTGNDILSCAYTRHASPCCHDDHTENLLNIPRS